MTNKNCLSWLDKGSRTTRWIKWILFAELVGSPFTAYLFLRAWDPPAPQWLMDFAKWLNQ